MCWSPLPQVPFLAWATTKGKIPMEDMLKKRNFKLANRCSMCYEEEELVDHLFGYLFIVEWSPLYDICHYR